MHAGHDAQALQSYDRYLRLRRAADAAEIRQSIRELKARAKSAQKRSKVTTSGYADLTRTLSDGRNTLWLASSVRAREVR